MSATVESLFDEYARRYIAGNVKGVASLCLCPFLAVRRGEPIHMPDRSVVLDHFASAIAAYRTAAHVDDWKRISFDVRQLGEYTVFVPVDWNAIAANVQ